MGTLLIPAMIIHCVPLVPATQGCLLAGTFIPTLALKGTTAKWAVEAKAYLMKGSWHHFHPVSTCGVSLRKGQVAIPSCFLNSPGN